MEFLKKMRENREEKVKAMENVLNAAKTENRAMTAEEQEKFGNIEKEIADIDKTIEAEERAIEAKNKNAGGGEPKKETQEELEERAFVKYVLGAAAGLEERAGELNLTMANNGAIVPTTIANKNSSKRLRTFLQSSPERLYIT